MKPQSLFVTHGDFMYAFLIALLVLRILIRAYLLIMIVRMILDWTMVLIPRLRLRLRLRGIFNFIARIIYFLTEPPLRLLRKFVPPMNCGRISFDVSYMLLYFVLYVLQIWL